MPTMIRLSVLTLVTAILFAGCGSNDDNSDANPGASGGMPSCSDVWVAGNTLPSDYEGCMDGDSEVVAVSVGDCGLTTYRDEFYALPGQKITEVSGEMADDSGYAEAFAAC